MRTEEGRSEQRCCREVPADASWSAHTREPLVAIEARLRQTLDNLLEGCQIIGFDWRYLYVNNAVARQGRRAKEELLGRRMTEVYPDIDRTEMFNHLRRCMEERTHYRMKNEFTYPDGDKGWFELSIQPVPEGILVLSLDATEHKRTEASLRESEERFRRLSEVGFEGVFIHRAGRLLDANRRACTMFGVEPSEVPGMRVLDFVSPEWRDEVRRNMAFGYEGPYEAVALRKDGTTFAAEVRAQTISFESRPARVVAIRDITERKRADTALQEAREELEERVERRMRQGHPYKLTFRELTVLHLVASGKADKQIGAELGISAQTVSKHVVHILEKMGAASRTEASVRALKDGLLT